jgi:hypothetical protein
MMEFKGFFDGLKINYESMSERDRRQIVIAAFIAVLILIFILIKIATAPDAGVASAAGNKPSKVVDLKTGPDTDWLDGAISTNSAHQRRELKKEIDSLSQQLLAASNKTGQDVTEIKNAIKQLKSASEKLTIEIAKEGSQRRAADKLLAQQIDNGLSSGGGVYPGISAPGASASADLASVDGNFDSPVAVGSGSQPVARNPFDMFSVIRSVGVSPSSLGRSVAPQAQLAANPSGAAVATSTEAANQENKAIDRNGVVDPSQASSGSSEAGAPRSRSKRVLVKIPSGSLITARMVTGLNAVVANTADTDKMFVVAKLTDPILMPNRKKVSLRGCVIMGGAKGDLSTERVYINSTVVSCIGSDDVLYEGNVQANAVGEDGVVGMRGRPVTKDGALILQSTSVGLLQGFAQAFSESSNRPQIVTDSSGDYQLPQLDYVAKSSAASGIDKGLDQLLKRANSILDQIFPVLEIDAGRTIEFVVQNAFEIKEI